MARYLDPKADIVFKRIFGEHPHLLKSFLNAVLPLTEDQYVVELEYLTPEQVPHIPTFKRTIVDVKCQDKKGRFFIVEMQINWTQSFKQRLLFSASQAIVKQLDKGEDYHLLQPVYGLGIVADVYEPESPEWYHHYQLVERADDYHRKIEHLQLVFVELPKFVARSVEEKRLRLLWLRFLREIDEKTESVSPELLEVSEISEAIKLTEQAAYNRGELEAYEQYWDSVRIEKTFFGDAIRTGYARGHAEGHAEGRAEGQAEGQAKGREEERFLIARQLLSAGLDIAFISKTTGLAIEHLKKWV